MNFITGFLECFCYFVILVLLYKTNLEISAHLCMQMFSQESHDSQEHLLISLQMTVFCKMQIIVNVSVVFTSLAINTQINVLQCLYHSDDVRFICDY